MLGREQEQSSEQLAAIEHELIKRFLEEASYSNVDAGFLDIPSVNQYIDTEMQGWAADLVVGHVRLKGLEFDSVVGVPDSGVPFANSVAERLRLPLIRAVKGEDPPETWKHLTRVEPPTRSFTRKKSSPFILNHDGNERLLVVEDAIAHGSTLSKWIPALREKGNEVFVAAYFAKLFQGGIDSLIAMGVDHFYAIGILEGHYIVEDALKPKLTPPQFAP